MRYTVTILGVIITVLACGCATNRSFQETEIEQLRKQVSSLSNKVESLNQQLQKTKEDLKNTNNTFNRTLNYVEEEMNQPKVMEELRSVPE